MPEHNHPPTPALPQTYDRALGILEQWAREREISQHGTVEGQAKKTIEEAGEILDALEEMQAAADERRRAWENKSGRDHDDARAREIIAAQQLDDALGDTGVAWIMACLCAHRDPVRMLFKAIKEIRDRRGRMGPDGIFHKQT